MQNRALRMAGADSNRRSGPAVLLLVIAGHAAALTGLLKLHGERPPTEQPILVTLVPPEPVAVAPRPEPPKPQPKKTVEQPEPVKRQVEPQLQKPPVRPESRLAADVPEPVAAMVPLAPAPAELLEKPASETAPAQSAPVKTAEREPQEEPVEPPRFNADYLANPAPAYPPISRRTGEQGRVLLRVHVTAAGQPAQVALHKSSGYARLDETAVETVRNWKFVPARHGSHAVEAWVIVPIQFSLKG